MHSGSDSVILLHPSILMNSTRNERTVLSDSVQNLESTQSCPIGGKPTLRGTIILPLVSSGRNENAQGNECQSGNCPECMMYPECALSRQSPSLGGAGKPGWATASTRFPIPGGEEGAFLPFSSLSPIPRASLTFLCFLILSLMLLSIFSDTI